ncbi:Ferredoxin--NADP reductase [Candidatus Kinetoplastibacterium sorsogonicusi]|uniref:ferredoxin--NADP(+) reductase n=1 Tax=Candidatus Kinetoplastidibacterium kentomonadis TaxID=1576550 RepID=A0A3Q8EU66_9PROT|nr:ferredoxin--NADP reductase [Candidatus Kinetoplastibacterium sorsogonicusi]AWD32455.1 Ferredoxin--NADP reductase [Candidatus Kinetoplastibacterium sorsogonicusi]
MSIFSKEKILEVYHWNNSLFSFKTTRNRSLKFNSGHFLMIGLNINNSIISRAYSIVSSTYDEYLEFLSIKINNGQFTSVLQNIKKNEEILIGTKPVGTLTIDNLLPGKHLYLLSTGTGIAPFLSIIKDFETYELFNKIILVHCVRYIKDLVYQNYILNDLPNHLILGDIIKKKLIYYPIVTRENFEHQGRITDLIDTNKITQDIKLPELNYSHDRIMICGNPQMIYDISKILENKQFSMSTNSKIGNYVIERAFVSK